MCITRKSWPLVDMKLTVNVRMGPWPYYFLFCLQWLAIGWLRITVSKSLVNYLIQTSTFLWGSIDAHSKNWELIVSLALLLIKAANMMVALNRKHIPFQSPYLHCQISLTLFDGQLKVAATCSSKYISVQARWLRECGRTASELS